LAGMATGVWSSAFQAGLEEATPKLDTGLGWSVSPRDVQATSAVRLRRSAAEANAANAAARSKEVSLDAFRAREATAATRVAADVAKIAALGQRFSLSEWIFPHPSACRSRENPILIWRSLVFAAMAEYTNTSLAAKEGLFDFLFNIIELPWRCGPEMVLADGGSGNGKFNLAVGLASFLLHGSLPHGLYSVEICDVYVATQKRNHAALLSLFTWAFDDSQRQFHQDLGDFVYSAAASMVTHFHMFDYLFDTATLEKVVDAIIGNYMPNLVCIITSNAAMVVKPLTSGDGARQAPGWVCARVFDVESGEARLTQLNCGCSLWNP
jgi:hypothetical protein